MVLKREVEEIIENDIRLKDLPISLDIVGGVAHIWGNVSTIDELWTIRKILSGKDGLWGIWDIVEINGGKPVIADIGCGNKKQVSDAVGIDQLAIEGVDIVTNLEEVLPIADNYFDTIFAIHVVEHIHNLVGLMNELHRILKPNGVLNLITPFWKYPTAVADPTHVRYMHPKTLEYFCHGREGVARWKPIMVKTSEDTIYATLRPEKNNEAIDYSLISRWFY